MIGRPFLSDSIPMLTDSFCPIVYQRQRVTRAAQDLKSCECYAREVVDAPNPHLPCLQHYAQLREKFSADNAYCHSSGLVEHVL